MEQDMKSVNDEAEPQQKDDNADVWPPANNAAQRGNENG